jgi:hypothetical protein
MQVHPELAGAKRLSAKHLNALWPRNPLLSATILRCTCIEVRQAAVRVPLDGQASLDPGATGIRLVMGNRKLLIGNFFNFFRTKAVSAAYNLLKWARS